MTFKDNEKIINIIKENQLFIITSHVGPDGDNVGSSCGFLQYLRENGKEAYYVMDEALPSNLDFLYKDCGYINSQEAQTKISNRNYTIIVLDCGDENRIQCEKNLFENAKIKINIDHHVSNKGFGDYNLIKKTSSSTSQVIWELIKELGSEKISDKVATCLYTGIVTDSGNFMYSSANADTLQSAAMLLKKGANKELIMEKLYRNKPLGITRLLAMVLATLEIKDNVAAMYMRKSMLEETGVKYNETEELVNYAVEIDGIDIGYLIKEKEENLIKVSLRSKSNKYNVSKITEKLGGGGHIMAAGCTINSDIETAKQIVAREIGEYIKNV